MSEQEFQDISPEEVKDFLQTGTREEGMGLSAEEIKALGLNTRSQEEEEAPPAKELPKQPGMDGERPNISDVASWAARMGKTGANVTVTPAERRQYAKSALTDSPFELPITLGTDIHILVRSLSEYEVSVVVGAAELDLQEGKVTTDAGVVTMIQNYTLVTEVQRVGNLPFPYAFIIPKEGTMQDACAALRKFYAERVSPRIQVPYREMLLAATRAFAMKMWICDTNWYNRDFWTTSEPS